MKLFVLAACGVSVLVGTDAVAQQRQSCTGPEIGTWKLQSYTITDVATGSPKNALTGKEGFSELTWTKIE